MAYPLDLVRDPIYYSLDRYAPSQVATASTAGLAADPLARSTGLVHTRKGELRCRNEVNLGDGGHRSACMHFLGPVSNSSGRAIYTPYAINAVIGTTEPNVGIGLWCGISPETPSNDAGGQSIAWSRLIDIGTSGVKGNRLKFQGTVLLEGFTDVSGTDFTERAVAFGFSLVPLGNEDPPSSKYFCGMSVQRLVGDRMSVFDERIT